MESIFLYFVFIPIILSIIIFTILFFYFSAYKFKTLPLALSEGFKASRYILTRGQQDGNTDFYYDIDLSITNHKMLKPIVDWFVATINKVTQYQHVDKIAFIEKDSGPVGALLLTGILVEKTKIPAVIIRLRRRLLINSIKGNNPRIGDNVILISDVATTGGGIKNAIKKLKSSGINVVAAIVLINRIKGGGDIKDIGVPLFYALEVKKKGDLQIEPMKKFIDIQMDRKEKEEKNRSPLKKAA